MNLHFNQSLAKNYHSEPQKVRVLSEAWVEENSYCTNCSAQSLAEFANNKPVADFYCENCNEQYELKSKKAKLSNVVNDGAYKTMIERINSKNNPSFFFLTYSKEYTVNNFLIIPKHFFTPDIIVKRKPLSVNAKRAGWVGCNIDLRQVPESGKVFWSKTNKLYRVKMSPNISKRLYFYASNLWLHAVGHSISGNVSTDSMTVFLSIKSMLLLMSCSSNILKTTT